jgi:stress response protein SCP2
VFYEKLESENKSVRHLGENLTLDRSEEDSEQIVIDFSKLDISVRTLIFCVNSYSLIPFSKNQTIFVHICDYSSGRELVRLEFDELLSYDENFTALVLCSVRIILTHTKHTKHTHTFSLLFSLNLSHFHSFNSFSYHIAIRFMNLI